MLSMEIEYYQENMEYLKKKKLKAFQNTVAIFEINAIDFRFFLFLYVGLLGFVVIAYLFCVLLQWCFQ